MNTLLSEGLLVLIDGSTHGFPQPTIAFPDTFLVWTEEPDSRGSDYVPVHLTAPQRAPKRRRCHQIILLDNLRSYMSARESSTLLDNILTSLKKATRITAEPDLVTAPT